MTTTSKLTWQDHSQKLLDRWFRQQANLLFPDPSYWGALSVAALVVFIPLWSGSLYLYSKGLPFSELWPFFGIAGLNFALSLYFTFRSHSYRTFDPLVPFWHRKQLAEEYIARGGSPLGLGRWLDPYFDVSYRTARELLKTYSEPKASATCPTMRSSEG